MSKEKLWKTLRKSGELLLKTILKDYKKVWLLGCKILRNEGWLKTFTQYWMWCVPCTLPDKLWKLTAVSVSVKDHLWLIQAFWFTVGGLLLADRGTWGKAPEAAGVQHANRGLQRGGGHTQRSLGRRGQVWVRGKTRKSYGMKPKHFPSHRLILWDLYLGK